MSNYLTIESTSGLDMPVRESMKFKTGKFVWKVRFSTALDPRTVNNDNIYVTSDQGMLQVNIIYDSARDEIQIEPLEPYAQDETYTLHLTTKVASMGGKNLKEEVEVQFKL